MTCDVAIVGAGLAGLSCARRLEQAGLSCRISEAADQVGGRVRTDNVDGFLLDRGFQIFLTSYREPRQWLDIDRLRLQAFEPGALIRHAGKFHRLADPWRQPLAGLRSLLSGVISLNDKLGVGRLRAQLLDESVEELFQQPETTTLQALQTMGFSEQIIERFFRPFLGGVFFDRELTTSSRMFTFVFRAFSEGAACVPAKGMQAIPEQLAAGLHADTIQLNTPIQGVQTGSVLSEAGEETKARAVVVATEAPTAARLLGEEIPHDGNGVTCLYFAAEKPPLEDPVLVLNGEGTGPVNNLCVASNIAPSYAPKGQSLISVTVLGIPAEADAELQTEVIDQLVDWHGEAVRNWRHLRTYRIPYALPSQAAPALAEPHRPVRCGEGLYVCGDHRDNASIEGAMLSGRRAAEAILEDLG